jgi:hypothetical protein
MLCSDVRGRISALLDEHLEDAERAAIEEHLEGCAPCRAELEELEAVGTALRGTPQPEPPTGYHEHLWSRLKMAIQDEEKQSEKVEDSGLIDIRKMASRDIEAQEAARKREEEEAVAAVAATEIPPHVSQPMMAVQVPAAKTGRGWTVPAVALGGLVVVAGVVFALLANNKREIHRMAGPEEAAPAPVPVAMPGSPPQVGHATGAPAAASQALAPGAVALAAPQEAGAGKPAAAVDPAERKAQADKRDEEKHPAAEPKAGAKGPKAAAAPAKEAAKPGAAKAGEPKIEAPAPAAKKGDALDALLNTGPAPKEEKKAAAEEENLPEELTPAQIKGGMAGAKAKVQACFDKYQVAGTAKVALTIAKNGKITSAKSVGQFAGTPTGDCVLAAVKGATFPRFKGKPLVITYPFLLR